MTEIGKSSNPGFPLNRFSSTVLIGLSVFNLGAVGQSSEEPKLGQQIKTAFVNVRNALEESDLSKVAKHTFFETRKDYQRIKSRLQKSYEQSDEEFVLNKWVGPLEDRVKLIGPKHVEGNKYLCLVLEDRGRSSWLAYELVAKVVNQGEVKIRIPEYFMAMDREEVGEIATNSMKLREKEYVANILSLNTASFAKMVKELVVLYELYKETATNVSGGPKLMIPQLAVPPGLLEKISNAAEGDQRKVLEDYFEEKFSSQSTPIGTQKRQ
ncbi:MAG: hypothetical protein H6751_12375 [Candidatus Omnitrophica bacterium]|nr:hypothetical protein [Candidatus Omnitrophota bacterium]MCB9783751.1 hypothetical protein [Candidatus Omnitrophota bacterium]